MEKIKPWIDLAAAIIKSGRMEHDKRFLESNWCDTLKDAVINYAYRTRGRDINMGQLQRESGGKNES